MARASSKRPSLYELMRSRPGPAPVHEEVADPPEPPEEEYEDDEPTTSIGPGRAISLPVGYLMLAAAVVAVLGILAYIGGYTRASTHFEDLLEEDLLAETDPGAAAPQKDPLVGGQTDLPVFGRPEPMRSITMGAAVPGMDTAPVAAAEPAGGDDGWEPVHFDPRKPGNKYFVLMETYSEGAERLARYCREHGLETYVVVSHNNRSRSLVIALPGFPRTTSSSDREFETLRNKIYTIGQGWKQAGGVRDLNDAYPLNYPPR